MMTIAAAMTPPAMAPFWSVLSTLDSDVDVGGVGVGEGVELDVEEEVLALALDDVVEAMTFVPLIGIGVAVATAPTPLNAAPGMIYDHTMIQRMAELGSGSAIPAARWSLPSPLGDKGRSSGLKQLFEH